MTPDWKGIAEGTLPAVLAIFQVLYSQRCERRLTDQHEGNPNLRAWAAVVTTAEEQNPAREIVLRGKAREESVRATMRDQLLTPMREFSRQQDVVNVICTTAVAIITVFTLSLFSVLGACAFVAVAFLVERQYHIPPDAMGRVLLAVNGGLIAFSFAKGAGLLPVSLAG